MDTLDLPDHEGRRVRLTAERLAHILNHPELTGFFDAIAETLRAPDSVVRSRLDPQVALSYRYYLRTLVGGKWLCVVVKYTESDAFVLTAYLTDKIKVGEVIWSKT